MLQRTVNGEEIFFFYYSIKEAYFILFRGEISYSKEKPVTDQDIMNEEMELARIREEIAITRFLNTVNEIEL